SYRDITIKRNGNAIAHVDLYDFLINGKLPHIQFRSGDTIVVDERGPTITVTGDVKRSYQFELTADSLRGKQIVQLAYLDAGVSNVLVRGSRASGPFARYYSLNQFRHQSLRGGDE